MRTRPHWIALVALALTSACGPTETVGGPTTSPPPTPTPTPSPTPTPTPSPASPGTGATPAVDQLHVVARVLEQGPIGSGNCSQRSYRVEVLSGDPLPTPSWVHFEHCADAPAPTFAGTALAVGAQYRLTLARGASANFGDDPMIVGVDPAAAP